MNLNFWKMLFLREFWEHRTSTLVTPVILAGVWVLLVSGLLLSGLSNVLEINGQALDFQQLRSQLGPEELQQVKEAGRSLVNLWFWPFFLVGALVQVLYLLGTLYEERKDRSIIFWRSLPVSDLQVLLTKLVFGVLVIPFVYGGAFLLALAVTLGVSIPVTSWSSNLPWGWLLESTHLFQYVGQLWFSLPLFALWLVPLACWLLFASMVAGKLPMLWAALPWLGLSLLESTLSVLNSTPRWLLDGLSSLRGYYNFSDRYGDPQTINLVWTPLELFRLDFWMDVRHLVAWAVGAALFRAVLMLQRHRRQAL
jgi:ABC-2 type transport system permease protein